jgi:hypothetical protein
VSVRTAITCAASGRAAKSAASAGSAEAGGASAGAAHSARAGMRGAAVDRDRLPASDQRRERRIDGLQQVQQQRALARRAGRCVRVEHLQPVDAVEIGAQRHLRAPQPVAAGLRERAAGRGGVMARSPAGRAKLSVTRAPVSRTT